MDIPLSCLQSGLTVRQRHRNIRPHEHRLTGGSVTQPSSSTCLSCFSTHTHVCLCVCVCVHTAPTVGPPSKPCSRRTQLKIFQCYQNYGCLEKVCCHPKPRGNPRGPSNSVWPMYTPTRVPSSPKPTVTCVFANKHKQSQNSMSSLRPPHCNDMRACRVANSSGMEGRPAEGGCPCALPGGDPRLGGCALRSIMACTRTRHAAGGVDTHGLPSPLITRPL